MNACVNCKHLGLVSRRCGKWRAHIRSPKRSGCIDFAARPQPIATIRRTLADADLLRFVVELRDTPDGRVLRLRHGVPEAERFDLYRTAGLRVIEPRRLLAQRQPSAPARAEPSQASIGRAA